MIKESQRELEIENCDLDISINFGNVNVKTLIGIEIQHDGNTNN